MRRPITHLRTENDLPAGGPPPEWEEEDEPDEPEPDTWLGAVSAAAARSVERKDTHD